MRTLGECLPVIKPRAQTSLAARSSPASARGECVRMCIWWCGDSLLGVLIVRSIFLVSRAHEENSIHICPTRRA